MPAESLPLILSLIMPMAYHSIDGNVSQRFRDSFLKSFTILVDLVL